MKELQGSTSDRIRSGDIPADSLNPGRNQPEPPAEAVRQAEGHGLGRGATPGRNGGVS